MFTSSHFQFVCFQLKKYQYTQNRGNCQQEVFKATVKKERESVAGYGLRGLRGRTLKNRGKKTAMRLFTSQHATRSRLRRRRLFARRAPPHYSIFPTFHHSRCERSEL